MSSGEVEIVLVEDNPNDAELITRSLQKTQPGQQDRAPEGWRRGAGVFVWPGRFDVKQHDGCDPKVVLLDIKLPKVDGIEVLRRMKSDGRTKDIPVVILTSSNEDRDIKEAYALGVNSFVTKPIKFEEFAKVVAELGIYWLMVNVPPVQ